MRTHAAIPPIELVKSFHERSATLFLCLLVAGDLAFIALHLANHRLDVHRLLHLDVDRGYPEFYQYMKFFWICVLMSYASCRWGSRHYIPWILLFAYMLLDDALGIHERGGVLIAASLSFEPRFGLRPRDYGELAVTTAAGAALLLPLAYAYRRGPPTLRRTSHDLALLTGILVFFGVVIDMAHVAIEPGEIVDVLIGTIEDGGEMLSASLILWYVFLIAVRPGDNRFYLCDLARSALTRRAGVRPGADQPRI